MKRYRIKSEIKKPVSYLRMVGFCLIPLFIMCRGWADLAG